jgi:hypothetical protein
MPWHVLGKLYAVASTSANNGLAGFFDDLVRCETRLYNAVSERLRAEHGMAGAAALATLRRTLEQQGVGIPVG